jgi:hypothetical protein
MTVAFAALHERLRYRREDTGLHVLALSDGVMFFSRRQPPLYDALAKLLAQREVPPGSFVNVRYNEERGVKWMHAVQVVKVAEDEAPFDPIPDDGHL